MKEAVGELNTTVIVAAAVSVMAAFFFMYLWPMISDNLDAASNCKNAICEGCPTGNCTEVECYIKDNPENKFSCSYKG